MKIQIPSDWDGTSWSCVQIQWPDSSQWFAILAGLISQPNRTWLWDSDSQFDMNLLAVLATAQDILARNWPWRDCEGEIIPPTNGQEPNGLGGIGGMLCLMEDCCMGCFDISRMLRINNGVLEALDSCCNWVAIGAISGPDSVEVLDENPLFDPDADPPQDWAGCGKATAIIESLASFVGAVYDHHLDDPLDYRATMADLFPQYSLYLPYLMGLFSDGLLFMTLLEKSNFVNDDLTALMICKLAAQMEDTSTVSDEEVDHVKSSISSAIHDYYGDTPILGDLGWFTIRSFYHKAFETIGSGDVRNTMLLGAADTSAVCDCPDLPEAPPEDLDWFHSFDFTLSDQGWPDPGSTGEYVAGEGWKSNEFGGYDINLSVNSPQKLNDTGIAQSYIMTFVRMTVSYCDPWVSGARANRVTLHNAADIVAEMDYTKDGPHVTLWSGYLGQSVANGANSNVTITLIRDECGAAAYYGIVSKLEIGGMGYDPLEPPTDP